MPRRLYLVLLILGIIAVILAIPAFWFSYPTLENYILAGRAGNELEVAFLDVGQGDAILIKTPYNQNILIDGGPDNTILAKLGEKLPFYDQRIDMIILTHPHDDHVTGLIEVIKRYEVVRVVYTGVLHTSPNFIAWLELIRDKNIPMVLIDRPQTVHLGPNCDLKILYPQEILNGKTVANLNNSSIVARLVYGETSFLFTGDAEIEVEQELLKNSDPHPSSPLGKEREFKENLKSNVLKVGHHGSDTSSSVEFLDAVYPELAIIPVGEDNQFGHPSLRTIKRLERQEAEILRTDINGTISIVSDANNYYVQ